MFLRFLLLTCLITVVACLTGVEIAKIGDNNGGCIVTLSQSKAVSENETEWIKLDGNYEIPCFDTIQKPNFGTFTITTKSDGTVYLTFIVLDSNDPKKLKISYLNPETNSFGSLKKVSDKTECFNENMEIFAYLNFKADGDNGKVRYGNSKDCITEIKENDFFNKEITELDSPDKKPQRKKREGLLQILQSSPSTNLLPAPINKVELLAEPLYAVLSSSKIFPSKVTAVNEVTNIDTSCGIYPNEIYCGLNEIQSDLLKNVKNPSLFAMGNATILKMSDRFNRTSPESQQYVLMTDAESHIETWPNFVYIFNETAFEKPFFFSVNLENSSSSTLLFFYTFIIALMIQFLLI